MAYQFEPTTTITTATTTTTTTTTYTIATTYVTTASTRDLLVFTILSVATCCELDLWTLSLLNQFESCKGSSNILHHATPVVV